MTEIRMEQALVQQRLAFGDEPIVLVGQPRHVEGMVCIRNPGAERVRLRHISLHASGTLASVCGRDGRLNVPVPLSLGDGEAILRRLVLRLPATTPPGVYQAQLTASDRVHTVTLHVHEHREVRTTPGSLTRGVRTGETFTAVVGVSNHGNVPVEIPSRAALEMHDGEVFWPHHFHAAAKAHGDEGHEAFLDAFVKKLGQAEPPLGRVKIVEGAGLLGPGASRMLTIEVSVPKTLHVGRAYQARVRLGQARLFLRLHVASAEEAAGEATPAQG